jgi:hypothetical protein
MRITRDEQRRAAACLRILGYHRRHSERRGDRLAHLGDRLAHLQDGCGIRWNCTPDNRWSIMPPQDQIVDAVMARALQADAVRTHPPFAASRCYHGMIVPHHALKCADRPALMSKVMPEICSAAGPARKLMATAISSGFKTPTGNVWPFSAAIRLSCSWSELST